MTKKKKYVNLEHAEEKLTEAIVILKKESDATQTDISTIMKTASVTKKWYKISRSCETLLDLQERAIKVWVPLEWRLERYLAKPVELSPLLGWVWIFGRSCLLAKTSAMDPSRSSEKA